MPKAWNSGWWSSWAPKSGTCRTAAASSITWTLLHARRSSNASGTCFTWPAPAPGSGCSSVRAESPAGSWRTGRSVEHRSEPAVDEPAAQFTGLAAVQRSVRPHEQGGGQARSAVTPVQFDGAVAAVELDGKIDTDAVQETGRHVTALTDVDADDGCAPAFPVPLHGGQRRHFPAARTAPAGPEVQDDGGAPEFTQFHFRA